MQTIDISSIGDATLASSLSGKYIENMTLDLKSLSVLPYGFYKINYGVDGFTNKFIIYNGRDKEIYQVGQNIFPGDEATTVVGDNRLTTTTTDAQGNKHQNYIYYTPIYIEQAKGILNHYGSYVYDAIEDTITSLSSMVSNVGSGGLFNIGDKIKTAAIWVGGGFLIIELIRRSK